MKLSEEKKFSRFSLLLKFLSLNGQKQIVDKKVNASDMRWHKLNFFSVFLPFNNSLSWLGETPFLTSDKNCDKAIKWILCGWLGLTGPVWEMADPPNCQKRSLLSACLRLTLSFRRAGIHLSDGNESVIETGRYVLNGKHRLHFNTIFYLWNKWPICVVAISPIEQLKDCQNFLKCSFCFIFLQITNIIPS